MLYVLADQWYRERVALRFAGAKEDDPWGESLREAIRRVKRPGVNRRHQVRALGGEVG